MKAVGIFSAAINLLTLTGSFYMLQVYDRVLVSRSVETLVLLSAISLLAFALQGSLDSIRNRMMNRIGAQIDQDLSPLAFRVSTTLPLHGANATEAMQPLRDVDQLRAFLGSTGPTAFFDLPFMPIFIFGCFLLHPWLGWFSVIGGAVILLLTLITEMRTRNPVKQANNSAARRIIFSESVRRQADSISAMGMHQVLGERWERLGRDFRRTSLEASDIQSGLGAFAKIFRMILQSGILGFGAYLALQEEISGGAMIAGSIMMSRAIAPLETAIANWKGFIGARLAYARLKKSLDGVSLDEPEAFAKPAETLALEGVTIIPPGLAEPVVQNAAFDLASGEGLGIIGPSGSGKSSLARAIVGVWQPSKGAVRLDGVALDQWPTSDLGKHIGYLPQDTSLLDGTVLEVISRFEEGRNLHKTIHAAKAAGAHELILKLPMGYATPIGDGGVVLSGGQRQRIALARALYGDPFLVVLDEPNSNLDTDGDVALTKAITGIRERGGIVIVITHRPSGLAGVDTVAFFADKTVKMMGPKAEVLTKLSRIAEVIPVRRPGDGERTVEVANG